MSFPGQGLFNCFRTTRVDLFVRLFLALFIVQFGFVPGLLGRFAGLRRR